MAQQLKLISSELERQRTIAENKALLEGLGLHDGGDARLNLPSSKHASVAPIAKKRKSAPAPKPDSEGPRRRSARVAGIVAEGPELEKIEKAAELVREAERVANRKERQQVMSVASMVEETPEKLIPELERFLPELAACKAARHFPSSKTSIKEAYADKPAMDRGVERLKEQFKDMTLRANPKVTTERVFCMQVHPEPTKKVVLVGDKYGQLGIWDALGAAPEKGGDDDADDDEDDGTGRVWRVQAHARNSISCMKIDPVAGARVITSSYDCSIRSLDFATLTSTELFTFMPDDDNLVTHFDLTPNGNEAWVVDKNGGISHVDFREGKKGERRRWVVQEEGRGAKLGGVSINPVLPHLIVTAGNDQHLRLWDVRQLGKMDVKASEKLEAPEPPRRTTLPPLKAEPDPSTPAKRTRREISPIVKEEATTPRRSTRGASTPSTSAHVKRTSRRSNIADEDVKPDLKPDVDDAPLNELPPPEPLIPTHCTHSTPVERVQAYMDTKEGKGLHRAAFQHGKSCSAAYWDPWGRRVLTTSYDDNLRIFDLSPEQLTFPTLPSAGFKPRTVIRHNCQTGRWLTILRAQWSTNTDYAPYFTVGNMKRSLDVVAGNGEHIVKLWADPVTAVPAVTAAHPGRVDCVVGGNTSGRIQLWISGADS